MDVADTGAAGRRLWLAEPMQDPAELALLERFHSAADEELPAIADSALPWSLPKVRRAPRSAASAGPARA